MNEIVKAVWQFSYEDNFHYDYDHHYRRYEDNNHNGDVSQDYDDVDEDHHDYDKGNDHDDDESGQWGLGTGATMVGQLL